MNRNTGILGAIAITVITIFGFSVRPGGNESPATAGSGQSAAARNPGEIPEPAQQNLQAPCREINKRIAEFIINGLAAPESCKEHAAKEPAAKEPAAKKPAAEKPAKLSGILPPLQPPKVRYIVATLPDPVHTHFALLFDRLTEALQQAAQDQGYNYDGSWLPWNDEGRMYGSLTDQQKADALQKRQDEQPGVLVFRRALPQSSAWPPCGAEAKARCIPAPYSEALIVFVVGENPTGGIYLEQFKNAVDWIKALSPQKNWDEVRLLSPYFSGSLPSLAQALLENHFVKSSAPLIKWPDAAQSSAGKPVNPGPQEQAANGKKPQTTGQEAKSLVVFSGSVSSRAGIDWFTKFLQTTPGWFYSFQENDDAMIDRYCQYLQENLHYDTGKLAIISEDETAYGIIPSALPKQGADSKWLPHCDSLAEKKELKKENSQAHGPLYLYYPRDIASLRSAYEQQPSAGGTSPSGTGLGLSLDLAEPSSRQRDTIRNFGGKQTPLSQEATLFGITNLFKSHDIQFIVLRSSNPLDQVFLTRFLARAYPVARVILTGADLLFRRSSETAGFRGTLILSTYPLLTWQQDWTYWQEPESRHSHRAFPEDFAEGLYLATRFLIDGADLAGNENAPLWLPNTSVVIQDYAPPSWLLPDPTPSAAGTRPPTWLSVVGNEQLWPVAVLDSSTVGGQKGGKIGGQKGQEDSNLTSCDQSEYVDKLKKNLDEIKGKQAEATESFADIMTATLAGGEVGWAAAALGKRAEAYDPEKALAGAAVKEAQAKQIEGMPAGPSTLPCVATGAKYHAAEFHLPLSMFVCCVVILAWCFWHFFCCFFGSHASLIRLPGLSFSIPSSRSLAYFAPVPRWQHKALVFIGCSIMGLMAILIATTTGVFEVHPGSPLVNPWLDTVYCAVLGFLSWAALIFNYRILLRKGWRTFAAPVGAEAPPKGQPPGLKEKINTKKDEIKFKVHARVRLAARRRRRKQEQKKNAGLRRDVFSMVVGGIFFFLFCSLLAWIFYLLLVKPLGRANAVFVYWRSVNVFTGVSPLVPLLLLAAGLYGWFWYSLSGLALFNAGRPKLPPQACAAAIPMLCREQGGREIEHAALPLNLHYGLCLVSFAVPYTVIWLLSGQAGSIRSLGQVQYGRLYFAWLGLLIVLVLTEAWIMLHTWSRLRKLLLALDRLPLRRMLLALKGMSWGTVWKMSGNVIEQRYRLLSRQKESLQHLKNETDLFRKKHANSLVRQFDEKMDEPVLRSMVAPLSEQLTACYQKCKEFDDWFAQHYAAAETEIHPADLAAMRAFQEELAKTAGVVFLRILQPAWSEEKRSLVLDLSPSGAAASEDKHATESLEPHVRAAEEFFCLPYIGFIQNILGRIRSITFSITLLFIAATLSVASYPFDPRPLLGATFLALFAVIAAIIVFVYAEIHRDPTLSYITNTDPGKLGMDFWMKLIAFGIGPLVGLLTALFPEVTGFLTAWLQPGVQAIK